ncbi:MAG: hypothetical protein P0120_11420 [Nitrospira sp.]|nr:hypothetical protein [Nitrospira sp.]
MSMFDVIIGGWDGFRTTAGEFNGRSFSDPAEPLTGTGVIDLSRDRLSVHWVVVGRGKFKANTVRRRRFDGMEAN